MHLIWLTKSFVVNAEHDTRAEEGVIGVRKGSVIIVLVVPEAFARNPHTLSLDLADNRLDDDLVRRN